jgi:hypothetical protein
MECKRCKQELEAPSYPYWSNTGAVEPRKPDWSKLQTVPAVPVETVDLAEYADGSHPVGNILFAIYLGLTTLITLNTLRSVGTAVSRETWKSAIDPKSKLYLASFEPLYYLVCFGAVIFLLAAVILLVTLLAKSKVFLRMVVIYLFGQFLYFAVEGWLIFRLGTELSEKRIPGAGPMVNQIQWLPYLSIICILLTFIWFRYFTTSKRARLVFE